MAKWGRPSKCGSCGNCERCERARKARQEYQSLTVEQRRARMARRDRVRLRRADLARHARSRGRADYDVKRRAVWTVNNAIRDGRLERQPCEVCGAEAQAHHDDYARPLDVRWLCTTHHAQHHATA